MVFCLWMNALIVITATGMMVGGEDIGDNLTTVLIAALALNTGYIGLYQWDRGRNM